MKVSLSFNVYEDDVISVVRGEFRMIKQEIIDELNTINNRRTELHRLLHEVNEAEEKVRQGLAYRRAGRKAGNSRLLPKNY